MTRPLVSLHLPKTAGTSFARVLQGHFGAAYRADYVAPPMQTPRWQGRLQALRSGVRLRRDWHDADIGCVHGHFMACKYALALAGRDPVYITWLRDPVERVVSHYQYWRRDYDGSDPRQPLRNTMLAEDWSLERFALGPEMRNLYGQYLWRFDPRRFAFIGIVERYETDLAKIAARLGMVAPPGAHVLRNPQRTGPAYAIPATLRQRIRAHHRRDAALYEAVLAGRLG